MLRVLLSFLIFSTFGAQAAPDIPGVAPEVRFSANYDPQGELNDKAFDALVFEEYWQDIPRLREDVAAAFGKDWLDMYDKESDLGKSQACAMRYLRTKWFEKNVENEGGLYDEYGALYDYKKTYGASEVRNLSTMWNHYKRTRGTELAEYEAILREEQAKVRQERERLQAEQEKQQAKERQNAYIREIAITTGSIVAYLAVLAWLIRGNIKQGLALPRWAAIAATVLLLITVCGDRNIPDLFHNRYHVWQFYEIPDGYYQLLRLTVTATAAYLGYTAAKNKAHPLCVLACAATVILFQPLAPISFDREIWLWIDLATAPALLLCAMYGSKAGKPENEQT